MVGPARWRRGQPVVWRSLPRPDQVGYVLPGIAVADDESVAAVFQPHGSVCKVPSGPRGGPSGRMLLEWDGGHGDRLWTGPSTVRVHVVGTGYSVIRDWRPELQSYRGWYVNLEAPWRRTAIGFDSRDHVLDVTVADDLSSWAWKDEDEFAWSRRQGRLDDDLAETVRQAGRLAIRTLEGGGWPFSADWSRWRPDATWTTATLPEQWHLPFPTRAAADRDG